MMIHTVFMMVHYIHSKVCLFSTSYLIILSVPEVLRGGGGSLETFLGVGAPLGL